MARPRIEKFDSLWEILKEIEAWGNIEGKRSIYRGHTSYQHRLRPGIFRRQNERIKNNERHVFRELITQHPRDFADDIGVFEKLVRMQHYGLPTRLLDVTYNPLVAVYFACEISSGKDAEVIAIHVDEDHFKYFDSDTIRCISNLANLSQSEIREIKDCKKSDELNKSNSGARLYDFIMQERPNFKQNINIEHLKDTYLVSPRLNNPRIQSQDGAFFNIWSQ
ncbi:FRG domain-containing protein [Martelella alba]|uniref:FRG domain-containing protein n=1 Tax=Martelella alba TaxID=2590451 RepID=A0A506U3D1_9HYPH|nr:FRG domain-containing protein [Martelella alba]TPW27791.1 FRG domain-containing protein [Martelella alba]